MYNKYLLYERLFVLLKQRLSSPPKQRSGYILHRPVPRRNKSSFGWELPLSQPLRPFDLDQGLGESCIDLIARMKTYCMVVPASEEAK